MTNDKQLKRACVLYARTSEILVISEAMTTHGFEIHDQPVARLAVDATATCLGDVVLRALDAYRINALPTGSEGHYSDPVLQFAGVRTWGQLERSSRFVFLREGSGFISVVPTRRLPGGGYDHLKNVAVSCRPIAAEIGIAVMKAIGLCE